MNEIAQRELLVIGGAFLVGALLLFPALLHSRREARDGIRRNEIAAFKQILEQHYNQHATYPREFNAHPHRYVVVASDERGATAWYLQAELENEAATHAAYNAEEGQNFDYRVIANQGHTFYEVCGGTPTCGLADPR